MPKELNHRWLKGIDNEEDQKYIKKVLTNPIIRGIMFNIISENIELSRREMLSDEKFGLAAWPQKQAFELGKQKALQKLLDLLPDPE